MIGTRKGSGESDGENLERMRSILSPKISSNFVHSPSCYFERIPIYACTCKCKCN